MTLTLWQKFRRASILNILASGIYLETWNRLNGWSRNKVLTTMKCRAMTRLFGGVCYPLGDSEHYRLLKPSRRNSTFLESRKNRTTLYCSMLWPISDSQRNRIIFSVMNIWNWVHRGGILRLARVCCLGWIGQCSGSRAGFFPEVIFCYLKTTQRSLPSEISQRIECNSKSAHQDFGFESQRESRTEIARWY